MPAHIPPIGFLGEQRRERLKSPAPCGFAVLCDPHRCRSCPMRWHRASNRALRSHHSTAKRRWFQHIEKRSKTVFHRKCGGGSLI
jgi:hypothetical protein